MSGTTVITSSTIWTAPETADYYIAAFGGSGGSAGGSDGNGTAGGNGAEAAGHWRIPAGAQFWVVVGGAGDSDPPFAGNGGAGTFVVDQPINSPLVIAGGGGGASQGAVGNPGQAGTSGSTPANGYPGGTNGAGGGAYHDANGDNGDGGGGFLSNGGNSEGGGTPYGVGYPSIFDGDEPGSGFQSSSGGAGGVQSGGGGGGYSGGGGGANVGAGGGGGSIVTGDEQQIVGGQNGGNGYVVITNQGDATLPQITGIPLTQTGFTQTGTFLPFQNVVLTDPLGSMPGTLVVHYTGGTLTDPNVATDGSSISYDGSTQTTTYVVHGPTMAALQTDGRELGWTPGSSGTGIFNFGVINVGGIAATVNTIVTDSGVSTPPTLTDPGVSTPPTVTDPGVSTPPTVTDPGVSTPPTTCTVDAGLNAFLQSVGNGLDTFLQSTGNGLDSFLQSAGNSLDAFLQGAGRDLTFGDLFASLDGLLGKSDSAVSLSQNGGLSLNGTSYGAIGPNTVMSQDIPFLQNHDLSVCSA